MNKKLMSLALGAAFCAGTFASSGMAFAQDASQAPAQEAPAPAAAPEHGGHRQMDPEKQLANMTKRLNLTADQQNQIRPILTDRQQQMATLRADTSLSREDRISKMKSIREDSRSKIEAVLTAEQKQTFEKMQQRREHRGNHAQSGNQG